MISQEVIEEAATEIMTRAAIDIPEDYLAGVKAVADIETGDLSAFVLQAMIENWEAASEDRRPMCADTGLSLLRQGWQQCAPCRRFRWPRTRFAQRDRARHARYPAAPQSGASAVAHRPQ